jgi:DNA-binding NarL/FixJ family response regulator
MLQSVPAAVRSESVREKPTPPLITSHDMPRPHITVADGRRVQPTARELQVLHLICDGHTSKEIAARLGITFKTAACHRARLMEKADVHSSIALFRWALRNGFASLEREPHLLGPDSSEAKVV